MKLYTYFRSSASYRVRIALNLKGLDYESIPIHLVRDGGEQLKPEYRQINADGLVPALEDEFEGAHSVLNQSLAIIEYLEERYPTLPLLPRNILDRAYVRGLAFSIACDIHPISNLRVLRYLTGTLGVSEADKDAWYRHWCEQGLTALEATVVRSGKSGRFCFGDTPTLAECALVPQIYNAKRFKSDLSAIPTLLAINDRCLELDAFRNAAPEQQADAS